MKNWTGNKKSIYVTLGASSHCKDEREKNDYYATDPYAIDALFEKDSNFYDVLEPACGEGHLAENLLLLGRLGFACDLINRGFGEQRDFFSIESWDGDIITNPPYKFAQEFVEHSLRIIPEGRRVAMFLKLQFLEGQKRKTLFEKYPPEKVLVFSKRIKCAKNGDFEKVGSSAVAYAWFIWTRDEYKKTIIEWI